MALDDASRRNLVSQTRGRLATVGPDGAPQNKPVGFVYNAVSEGAPGTRFVEIRGQAERVSVEPPATAGVSPQIIRIHPRRVISWNVDPGPPGPADARCGRQSRRTRPDPPVLRYRCWRRAAREPGGGRLRRGAAGRLGPARCRPHQPALRR